MNQALQPSAFGSKILVEGLTLNPPRRQIRRPLTEEELSKLLKIRSTALRFDGDAEEFLLGAEAERIRIAHQFDPLFAGGGSR